MAARGHAQLSPSAAHRWLHCTAAPSFEAQFGDVSSAYAEEGTLAHSVCERVARHIIEGGDITDDAAVERIIRDDMLQPLWADEMIGTARQWAYAIMDLRSRIGAVHTALEQRVDLGGYVPDGFGTCDCVVLGTDTLWIADYKHGKGVRVEAEDNPQMMLYALGALEKYSVITDGIKTVGMTIVQPRICAEPSEWTIPAATLRAWGETIVRPAAKIAATGVGASYCPGDWCRFCRGKAKCATRAESYLELERLIKGNTLPDSDIGFILRRAEGIAEWIKSLQDYALTQILNGHPVDGWRVVEGTSRRAFSDTAKAFDRLRAEGFDDAMLYDRDPKSLAEIEKMLGKKRFGELLGYLVIKPQGKPSLVPYDDKRPDYSAAQADFGGIADGRDS